MISGRTKIDVQQVNLNKCYLAQVELGNKVSKLGTFIALVQEPYCYKTKVCLMPRATSVIASKDCPRALIISSKNLAIQEVSNLCTKDMAVGLVKLGGKQTLIASLYLDITCAPVSNDLLSLINFADQKRFALLIGVDTNAHGRLWMSSNDNSRGRAITDFIIENNIKLENIGSTPTFECSTGKSIIDLTLSRGLKLTVNQWRVCKKDNHSDHHTIRYCIEDYVMEIAEHRLWEKADWTMFQVLLQSQPIKHPEYINSGVVENMLDKVYKKIENALDGACPMAKASTAVSSNPWFTNALRAKRKEIFALWDKYMISKRQVDLERYKTKRKSYKKHCDKAKQKHRVAFKEKLNDVKDMSSYVNSITKQTPPNIGTIKRADGSYTLPGRETLKTLADIHFPGHNAEMQLAANSKTLAYDTVVASHTDWISIKKMEQVFSDFKSKKSPGTDKLKPIVFKYITRDMLVILEIIYKSMISLNFTPAKWREARVVFIPKPGKPDYTNPKAFRPISLTNYMLKGLEKLVRWKVDDMLVYHPLNKNQHGFRKGYGTETAISETVNFIEGNILNNKYCLGVFLDIQAAFDSISPVHIKSRLLRHGCPEEVAEWYYGYLTHRVIFIEGKHDQYRSIIGKGFPQGGVCSASFWAIAYNEAVEILNSRGLTGKVYADDSCALIGGTDLAYMFHRMNQVLMQLQEWGHKCGLKFNPSKTEAVLFSRDNPGSRKFTVPKLKMDNKIIQLSNTVKYLGVTLDRKLFWSDHIDNQINSCKQLMMKILADVRGYYGPRPKLVKWAYEGIIRPKLTYACLIWGHEVKTKAMLTKLKALDRLAVRSMATISRRAPQASIEVLTDLLPIELHIKKLGMQALVRLREILPKQAINYTKGRKRHGTPHLQYWHELLEANQIFLRTSDVCSQTVWDRTYTVNTASFDGHRKHRTHSEYTVYTDGSKTNEGTGAGFIIYHHRDVVIYNSIKLNDECTVFQAELLAIRSACTYLMENFSPKHVKFLSDSQAALKALDSQNYTSTIALTTAEKLEELSMTGANVRLAWVKAHVGLEGNELADSAAKLGGSDDMGTNERIILPIAKAHTKADIEQRIYKEWENQWTESGRYRMTKQFMSRPDKARGAQVMKLSKTVVTCIEHVCSCCLLLK